MTDEQDIRIDEVTDWEECRQGVLRTMIEEMLDVIPGEFKASNPIRRVRELAADYESCVNDSNRVTELEEAVKEIFCALSQGQTERAWKIADFQVHQKPTPSVTNEQTSGGEKDVVASVPAPGTSASFANHAPARGPEEAGSFIDHGVTRHASDMICPRCPSDSVSDECECPPEGHMLGCKRDRLEPLKQRASEASPFAIDPTVTRDDLIAGLRKFAVQSDLDRKIYWCRLCSTEWSEPATEWHRNTCTLRGQRPNDAQTRDRKQLALETAWRRESQTSKRCSQLQNKIEELTLALEEKGGLASRYGKLQRENQALTKENQRMATRIGRLRAMIKDGADDEDEAPRTDKATPGVQECIELLEKHASNLRYSATRILEDVSADVGASEDQADEFELRAAHVESCANLLRPLLTNQARTETALNTEKKR